MPAILHSTISPPVGAGHACDPAQHDLTACRSWPCLRSYTARALPPAILRHKKASSTTKCLEAFFYQNKLQRTTTPRVKSAGLRYAANHRYQ